MNPTTTEVLDSSKQEFTATEARLDAALARECKLGSAFLH